MNRLLLGIKGHAVCIDKFSGEQMWSVKLRSTSDVTNIFVDNDLVFVYSGGHLFCLDIRDGTVKWENKLKGKGYGPCILATENSNSSVAASHAVMQQSSVTISGSSSDSGGDGGD